MIQQKNQNKAFVLGFILILAVVGWSLSRSMLSKYSSGEDNSEKKINEEILKAPLIAPEDLYEDLKGKEKIILFDLRSADEFSRSHLAGAVNLQRESLNAQKMKSVGAEKTSIVVLMNQGDDVYETAQKTNELVAAGFVNTKYLQGGVKDWQIQGYTLISGGKDPLDSKKIKKMKIEELVGELLVSTDLVKFLDVRNSADFEKEHIPGTVNIPLSNLDKDQKSLSYMEKIIVYGKSEEEASQAAAILFDLNFFNVYVLEEGLDIWKKAGGRVEAGKE
jgi:rhodanese-related sulfurtransferase